MSIIEEAKKAVRAGQVSQMATILINGLIAENEKLKEQIKELESDNQNNGLDEK